jgi:hypothetical protein
LHDDLYYVRGPATRAEGFVARRHRPWLALVLFLSTGGTICRSATNPNGTNLGTAVPVSSSGKGGFSGTDGSGASLRATIAGAQVYLEVATSGDSVQSTFIAVAELGGDNGTENLEFSSPAGIISSNFAANIGFNGPPVPGTYTEQSSSVSGGVDLAYSTSSAGEGFSANAAVGASQATGSWTLVLTSVVATDGGSGPPASLAYETPHGTLTASLTDDHGGSGTLQLAF